MKSEITTEQIPQAKSGEARAKPSTAVRGFLYGIFAVIVAGVLYFAAQSSTPETVPEVIAAAPAFTLTTSTNTQLSSSELRGKIWLMNFFFTSCPGPCPLINTELKKFTTTPWLKDKVRLLSLTVDPERDTPQKLAEYATRYNAQPGKWDFLTGDTADIRTLIEGGFKLIAPDDVSMHTTRIVLVDGNGDIRGMYQGAEQDGLKQMFKDVSALARNEASQ